MPGIPRGARAATTLLIERVPVLTRDRVSVLAVGAVAAAHGLLALGCLGWALSGAAGWRWLTVGAVLGCGVAELALGPSTPFGTWAAERAGLGRSARMLLRAGLVLGASFVTAGTNGWAAVLLTVLAVTAATATGLAEAEHQARALPVLARGLDLPVRIPAPAARWVHRVRVLPLDVVAVLAVVAARLITGSSDGPATRVVVVVGWLLAVVPLALCCALLGRGALGAVRLGRVRMTHAVETALAVHRLEVVLHFAGEPDLLYQAAMWLDTLERMAEPAAVLVRSPEVLAAFPPTTVPVVCIETSTSLITFRWPASVRVALYVANAATNVHLLRERRWRHVFIGHGDSDKSVSTNPYAKVYDEVWEAGPAGRHRWAAADVGVRDEVVVEVGAPFLPDPVERLADRVGGPWQGDDREVTVAYVPTWEGVEDVGDPTSVGVCGLALVDRLARTPGVRVLYRPHPMTGRRNPAVRAAHRAILARLGLAEASEPIGQVVLVADPLALAAQPGGPSATAVRAEAVATSVRELAGPGHAYAPASRYPLEGVIDAADAVVCDVSSAMSAVIAAGRPLAVTDPVGSPELVRRRSPTAAVAYLVEADGAGTGAVVAAARGQDPLRDRRAELANWLFGEDGIGTAADPRFAAALAAAAARVRSEAPGR